MQPHETEGEQAAAGARDSPAIDTDYVVNFVNDLKSPLSVITLEASLLESRLGDTMTADTKRAIKRIERNAESLDRIVRDLLDAIIVADKHTAVVQLPPHVGTATLKGRHLLLVDDKLGQVEPLAEILSDEGLVVTTALSGHDALERLMANKPDLVALDVQMPGIDGLELLGLIHARWPDLPIVLMTAFAPDHPGIAAAMRTPATAYVGKPVELAQLVSTLIALVQSRPASSS